MKTFAHCKWVIKALKTKSFLIKFLLNDDISLSAWLFADLKWMRMLRNWMTCLYLNGNGNMRSDAASLVSIVHTQICSWLCLISAFDFYLQFLGRVELDKVANYTAPVAKSHRCMQQCKVYTNRWLCLSFKPRTSLLRHNYFAFSVRFETAARKEQCLKGFGTKRLRNNGSSAEKKANVISHKALGGDLLTSWQRRRLVWGSKRWRWNEFGQMVSVWLWKVLIWDWGGRFRNEERIVVCRNWWLPRNW